MQAVVMHETGDADVLRYEEIDRPEPGDGEVLIKVHAASVNPADWKLRRGFMNKPLPTVLGHDVSGTVETSRADGFAEGDEVFGSSASGGYAEYSTASAGVIAKKPAGVGIVTSIPPSRTAGSSGAPPEDAARERGVRAGESRAGRSDTGCRPHRLGRPCSTGAGSAAARRALVAGAAGGVGHFAVPSAPRPSTKSRLRVEPVPIARAPTTVANWADIALDTVGGDTTASPLTASPTSCCV
jgi:hypothetical protein